MILATDLHGLSRIKTFTTGAQGITEDIKFTVESVPEAALAAFEGKLDASGRRFAIVVSRFNSFIT